MSYHQWLSSAPKHHLTSSTPDGFSSFKLNTARPYSSQPPTEKNHPARRPMAPPTIPATKANQAPPFNRRDSGFAVSYSAAEYPVAVSPANFNPFTPPSEIDDMVQTGGEVYQKHREYRIRDVQVDSMEVEYSNRPQPNPNMSTTSSSHNRQSRDAKSGSISGNPAKKGSHRTMLPSPPQSPRMSTRPSPVPIRNVAVRKSSSHPKTLTGNRPAYDDPMMQTSTDPHYWAVNCTVLKADTRMEPGNVISPTCMIGLPFGGMVEMTLPLPPADSSELYDSV